MTRADVLRAVCDERDRQDLRWGEQNHIPSRWLDILVEEVGEVAKAILEAEPDTCTFTGGSVAAIRRELIQVAAVAVAAIESMDRRGAAC